MLGQGQRALELAQQHVAREGLGDVVHDAEAEGLHARGEVAVGRQEDHRVAGRVGVALQGLDHAVAVEAGHRDVAQHHVGLVRAHELDRPEGVGQAGDLVLRGAEHALDQRPDVGVVVDQHDLVAARAHGAVQRPSTVASSVARISRAPRGGRARRGLQADLEPLAHHRDQLRGRSLVRLPQAAPAAVAGERHQGDGHERLRLELLVGIGAHRQGRHLQAPVGPAPQVDRARLPARVALPVRVAVEHRAQSARDGRAVRRSVSRTGRSKVNRRICPRSSLAAWTSVTRATSPAGVAASGTVIAAGRAPQ